MGERERDLASRIYLGVFQKSGAVIRSPSNLAKQSGCYYRDTYEKDPPILKKQPFGGLHVSRAPKWIPTDYDPHHRDS